MKFGKKVNRNADQNRGHQDKNPGNYLYARRNIVVAKSVIHRETGKNQKSYQEQSVKNIDNKLHEVDFSSAKPDSKTFRAAASCF